MACQTRRTHIFGFDIVGGNGIQRTSESTVAFLAKHNLIATRTRRAIGRAWFIVGVAAIACIIIIIRRLVRFLFTFGAACSGRFDQSACLSVQSSSRTTSRSVQNAGCCLLRTRRRVIVLFTGNLFRHNGLFLSSLLLFFLTFTPSPSATIGNVDAMFLDGQIRSRSKKDKKTIFFTLRKLERAEVGPRIRFVCRCCGCS
ncbi:hypothetical protein BJV82DRAFT_61641 [Fennellomyces sp. T-0311]|nr:hypothetical protein BJV82DRAFT_61641 [Fennellomyces sp. T-0311]